MAISATIETIKDLLAFSFAETEFCSAFLATSSALAWFTESIKFNPLRVTYGVPTRWLAELPSAVLHTAYPIMRLSVMH